MLKFIIFNIINYFRSLDRTSTLFHFDIYSMRNILNFLKALKRSKWLISNNDELSIFFNFFPLLNHIFYILWRFIFQSLKNWKWLLNIHYFLFDFRIVFYCLLEQFLKKVIILWLPTCIGVNNPFATYLIFV